MPKMHPMDDNFAIPLLRDLFATALRAASPVERVASVLPPRPPGMVTVLGAGKASAAMARAVEEAWGPPVRGLVIVPDGYGVPCRHVEIVEAAHPVPDARGLEAARRILDMARGLGEGDFLLAPVSGGGSALMTLPAGNVSPADKRALNRALLKCGAAIDEINTVRRHVSAIKGGRLARAAWPAPVLALLLSDVPGDDPAVIASGPTIPDPTTRADARAVLARHAVEAPASVPAWLDDPRSETPKPGDGDMSRSEWEMVGTPAEVLEAVAAHARGAGLRVVNLGDRVQGEAREVARRHALLARRIAASTGGRPVLLLSGGETTVTVRGRGRGGRNTEYALALALALDGHPRIHALAADTDGIDGTTEAAGAIVRPDTLSRARAMGMDPLRKLADNDACGFFGGLGDLVVTGPTRTNVNDFRAILIS